MDRHGRAGLLTAQVLRRDEPGALHRLVRQEVRERGHAGGREILLVDRATIHGAEQVLRRGLERHAAVDAVVAKETGEGDIALRVGRALELRAGRMLHREADARRAVRAVGEERLEVGAGRVVAEITGVDVQEQRRSALDRGDVGRRLVVQRFGRCRGRNLGWRNRRGINDLLGWRHRGIDDLLGRRGDGRSRRFGGRHRCRRRGGGGRRLARIDDEPVTLDLLAEHVDECRDAVLVEFLLVARLTLVFAEEVIRAVLDRDVTEEAVVTVRQAGEGHLPFVVHLFLNGCAVGANERQRDRLFGIVRAIRGEILEGAAVARKVGALAGGHIEGEGRSLLLGRDHVQVADDILALRDVDAEGCRVIRRDRVRLFAIEELAADNEGVPLGREVHGDLILAAGNGARIDDAGAIRVRLLGGLVLRDAKRGVDRCHGHRDAGKTIRMTGIAQFLRGPGRARLAFADVDFQEAALTLGNIPFGDRQPRVLRGGNLQADRRQGQHKHDQPQPCHCPG